MTLRNEKWVLKELHSFPKATCSLFLSFLPLDDPPLAMGATTSASVPLPDDEACEAVLRKFIAEDLERAERLLHRAAELLGGWFMVFSRGAWVWSDPMCSTCADSEAGDGGTAELAERLEHQRPRWHNPSAPGG